MLEALCPSLREAGMVRALIPEGLTLPHGHVGVGMAQSISNVQHLPGRKACWLSLLPGPPGDPP